jgi:pyridoxamine 5'-phosphate oxidase
MKLAEINQKLKSIKAERLNSEPVEALVTDDPFELFLTWLDQAIQSEHADPSAMILATVDEQGYPNTRMVLLKELEDQRFIFYTNYDSKKGRELAHQNVAALNFYWPDLHYQVRIRGRVEKLSRQKNESYFATRERGSQLSAAAWTQSSIIAGDEELEKRVQLQEEKYAKQPVPCPENWGGYALSPFEYEFFQRRQWRRHQRLFYSLSGETWRKKSLAP